jgi:hypothetical protein
MDVRLMQQGMVTQRFKSVDLVKIFADRCFHIGRGLSLTSQENFDKAIRLAHEKDEEITEAIKKGVPDIFAIGIMQGIPIAVSDSIY